MMKALVVEGPKEFVYQEIPVPTASRRSIGKVEPAASAGPTYPASVTASIRSQIVGHEFSGDVVEVGSAVNPDLKGLRAAVAPWFLRSLRQLCQGRPAMCTEYSFIGSRQPGAMAEYVAVPARTSFPLTMKSRTNRRPASNRSPSPSTASNGPGNSSAARRPSSTAAVPSGFLTMQVLKAKGIERVYVDINQAKLDLAKSSAPMKSSIPRRRMFQLLQGTRPGRLRL